MKKYIILWVVSSLSIIFILFGATSLISNTEYSNILGEFEIILTLLGFAITISTIFTCTKFINDKLDKKLD